MSEWLLVSPNVDWRINLLLTQLDSLFILLFISVFPGFLCPGKDNSLCPMAGFCVKLSLPCQTDITCFSHTFRWFCVKLIFLTMCDLLPNQDKLFFTDKHERWRCNCVLCSHHHHWSSEKGLNWNVLPPTVIPPGLTTPGRHSRPATPPEPQCCPLLWSHLYSPH